MFTHRTIAMACVLLAIGGCGLPKDPEGTTERVQREGVFQVGIAAPASGARPAAQTEFLKRVATETDARPAIKNGPAEVLLEELETGKLDIVLGEFSTISPWSKAVSFMPPLAEKVTEDGHSLLTAAVRNGENEWVEIVHKEAVAVAANRHE